MAREVTSHRPPRGAAYHEEAIKYNEGMAARARELSVELNEKEIKRWCRAIARQHDEHIAFHNKALTRIKKQKARKKLQRQNNKARPKSRKPTVEENTTTHSRPIPRDPRVGKSPAPQQIEAGVGTEQKQEASE